MTQSHMMTGGASDILVMDAFGNHKKEKKEKTKENKPKGRTKSSHSQTKLN